MVTGRGWGPVQFEPRPDDSDYPLFVLPQFLSGYNHFHLYHGLSQVIAQFRPDILHIDEEHYSMVTAQALWAAKRLGIPLVLFQTWQNIFKPYPWPFSAIERFTFKGCARALAGTAEVSDVLRKKGFQGPIDIIPLGTDTDLYHPLTSAERVRLRQDYGIAQSFAVGYVGRLVEEKGLPDLFAAVLPLIADTPDIHLVIAGTGPWRAQGEAWAAKAGLNTRVHWIPWLPSKDMPGLMAALDVLVLPSRTTPRWKEQFGRVLTEAMAVGTPVVGSTSGEIPRVIEDAGVTFPEGDPLSLQRHLLLLYADASLRQSLAERGMARVQKLFTQEAVARRLSSVYMTMAAESRSI